MLLINPAQEKFGGFISRYMQIGIPVSIGILAAYMKKNGVVVNVFDEEIEFLTPSKVSELVRDLEKPYVFAISCLTAHVVRAYQLSKMLKSLYPDCTIILGGLHPTALPEEALREGADFAVRGEGEEVLLRLYQAIRGNKDYASVLGISYSVGGRVINNPEAPLIADIDKIPIFPYELFNNPKYDMGFMVSSRGCPYRCNYCSIRMMNGSTYRYLSAARVVEELDILINRFNQKSVLFYDDNFCFKKRRVKELCAAIMDAGLHKKASFSIQTRADNFYPDVVPMLAEAGFKHAGFGMETGVDRLAHIINKEETVEQHRQAVLLAQKNGMAVSLFMIFGLPTETHADRQESFEVVQSMLVQESKFNNLIPYPGTPMYDAMKNSPRLHIAPGWSNFNSTLSVTRSIFDKTPLAYVPETMSEFELKKDIILFNLKTFLKFRVLSGILLGRKGIGWLKLPKRWYFSPVELYHLAKTAVAVSANLLISSLPLILTEPFMNALNPAMKNRLRVKDAPKEVKIAGWGAESAYKYRTTTAAPAPLIAAK